MTDDGEEINDQEYSGGEEPEQPEEPETKDSEEGEHITDHPREGESEPEDSGSEETKETTTDVFTDFLAADLSQVQKQEFEESYKPLAEPLADLAGVDQGYPRAVNKLKKLPWPIRVILGGVGLLVTGIYVKSKVIGQSFKATFQKTIGIFKGNSGGKVQAAKKKKQQAKKEAQKAQNKNKPGNWREDVKNES